MGQQLLRVDWLGAGAPDTSAEGVLLSGVEQAAEAAGMPVEDESGIEWADAELREELGAETPS